MILSSPAFQFGATLESAFEVQGFDGVNWLTIEGFGSRQQAMKYSAYLTRNGGFRLGTSVFVKARVIEVIEEET